MLYLTCTTITSVDLAYYGVSRAKDWVSVDCGTLYNICRLLKHTVMCLNFVPHENINFHFGKLKKKLMVFFKCPDNEAYNSMFIISSEIF